MEKRKLIREYTLQVIKHSSKEIIYTDNTKFPTTEKDEVNVIGFRKIIGKDLSGYSIKFK